MEHAATWHIRECMPGPEGFEGKLQKCDGEYMAEKRE
jgi:hypothetical protein